jgi:hypothetical protein
VTAADSLAELLSEEDSAYVISKGYDAEATQVDGFVHLVIRNFPFPAPYAPSVSDLLLRLPLNFPSAKPDMFWTFPHVRLGSGAYPQASDQFDVNYQGRQWQRWSRHFPGEHWRPGIDNLKTYLGTIRRELQKGI